MRLKVGLDALLIGALVATAACGSERRSPTAPGPSAGTSPLRPLDTLTINGETSLTHLGDTTRLTATVTFADHTTKDVTSEVRWDALAKGVVVALAPGVFTASSYGTTPVVATYGRGSRPSAHAIIRVVPDGMFLLSGIVTDYGGVQISAAAVAATSDLGVFSAITNEYGFYAVPAVGHVVVRIEKEAFRTLAKQLMVSRDAALDWILPRIDAGGSTGQYTLTFSASPSCKLPPPAMRRVYDAEVVEVQQSIYVRVSGATFVAWGGQVGFTGTRDGERIAFVVRDTFDDGFNLIERISAVGDLYYVGTAAGTTTARGIVAAFDGTLRIGFSTWGGDGTCTAADHRMELVRVGEPARSSTGR